VQIGAGKLQPGRGIPSETTLMQEHGLARGRVRKAIDALADEGLVVRAQGRGAFVAEDRVLMNGRLFSSLIARNWESGNPTWRIRPAVNTLISHGIGPAKHQNLGTYWAQTTA
jgi:DNA-binding transcriptional regulator YhcF (GntR family)